MVTLEMVKANPIIKDFMDMGNAFLGNIGAIEHNLHHAELTARLAYEILATLDFPPREAELAAIAGYLHDIGNLVNRYGHGMSGALIAFSVLMEMGMDSNEIAVIMGLSATMKNMPRVVLSTVWRLPLPWLTNRM